jgi:hypothetical protein
MVVPGHKRERKVKDKTQDNLEIKRKTRKSERKL